LTSYASLLQSELIPSFWPAFTEAYKKREMRWVRKTYREMVRKVLLAVSVAALLIGLCGQWFIRMWAGEVAVPPLRLLWTMAAWAVLVSATTNQALLLTAVGRLRLETTVAVLAAVANLALSIVLVQRIGAEGVILATFLSFAVFMIVPQELEVRRVLRGDFLEPLPAAEPAGSSAAGETNLPAAASTHREGFDEGGAQERQQHEMHVTI
jgi:O-antigen/teichoic acid export membrane protein